MIIGFNLFLVTFCEAFCPLCLVAAGTGVGLSEYLGINDLITGLWLGASLVSLVAWSIKLPIINQIKGRLLGTVVIYYGSLWYVLKRQRLIGHELNRLYGIDRLILGIIVGSLSFYGFHVLYLYLKKRNNGRPYFAYQKVIMPVSGLLILSVIGYFL